WDVVLIHVLTPHARPLGLLVLDIEPACDPAQFGRFFHEPQRELLVSRANSRRLLLQTIGACRNLFGRSVGERVSLAAHPEWSVDVDRHERLAPALRPRSSSVGFQHTAAMIEAASHATSVSRIIGPPGCCVEVLDAFTSPFPNCRRPPVTSPQSGFGENFPHL